VLHRLTAAIVRDTPGLDGFALSSQYAEAVIVANAPGRPRDPKTWPAWADLTVHLLALDPGGTENASLRQLALDAILAQLARADTRSAETLCRGFLDVWPSLYGVEHPHVLTATSHLAWAKSMLGDHQAARRLDEEVLAVRRRVLGAEHPDTLWSASNVAVDLNELGEFEAARELDEQTLKIRRRVLGPEHPDTLRSANNLANDLSAIGEFAAARELNAETLVIRRRVLGVEHPDTHQSAKLAIDLCGDQSEGTP
jgi:tetratricopeptide (TPR) repeat protein